MERTKEELQLINRIEYLKKEIIKIIESHGNDLYHPDAKELDDELEKSINEYHMLYEYPRFCRNKKTQ